ncbi:cryptococcal mannosyltransferase 1-domain-containing protein [Mycena amicta]|nr:cryptococcal mannosyltransferase 1-domain-containing protein [Mycena amicta]
MPRQDGWRRMDFADTRQIIPLRLLSPLSWILSMLARTAFLTLPAYLFWRIYRYSWDYWMREYESGIFWPAFPIPRTRLVLLMVDIPVWGLCMLLGVPLWSLAQRFVVARFGRRHYYDSAIPMEDVDVRRRRNRTAQANNAAFLSPFSRKCLMVYLGLALSGVFLYLTHEYSADYRYRAAVEAANRVKRPQGHGDGTKVFIAAMFYNNSAILPYWIREFTKVIHYVGSDNVFVSIVESNSSDDTADILDEWKATLDTLGVRHLIRTRDKTIERPADMSTAIPRIKFLADTRNLVLAPLVERGGYDVVLFSNDVLVEAEAVVELLKTKNGQWDMVCGLDLHRWGMYDAWVLRDRVGKLVSSLWPYFLDEEDKQAVINDEPAPVFACWNGITAFSAEPFLPLTLRTPGRLSTSPLSTPLPSTHPAYPQSASLTPAQTPPLQFRHSAEKECFSAEAFNLPYDLRRQFDMQRIYLNPRVINSYERKWYLWFKYFTRHWVVRWWMRNVENGKGMEFAKMVIGEEKKVWSWDGGDCHPW